MTGDDESIQIESGGETDLLILRYRSEEEATGNLDFLELRISMIMNV